MVKTKVRKHKRSSKRYDGVRLADDLMDKGKLPDWAENELYDNPDKYNLTRSDLEAGLDSKKHEKAFVKSLNKKIRWVEKNPKKALDYFGFDAITRKEYEI